MSYLKIWIHLVWSTYCRKPFLVETIRHKVFFHMKEYAVSKNILLDHVNGYTDHVHCLVSLKSDQNIAAIAHLLKGESSFWINKNKLIKQKFGWQDDYFAVSVSESNIDRLRKYIRNQEDHHKMKSYQEECNEFIQEYNFKIEGESV